MDIQKIDKNFAVKTDIGKGDIKFYNIDEAPFKIYGVFKENGKYRRIPENIAKNVSDGVYSLHSNTAGGRVRFITDSSYIAIHAEMENLCKLPHFAFTAAIGFDLYADGDYVNTYIPPINVSDGYEGVVNFPSKELRGITINFPLYSDVKNLYIGLQKDATVKEALPYRNSKPIVYYGSSITQGGCASRPGMCYQALLSNKMNYDYINLGFSGSAKAEDGMIDYIKKLDMSIFVCDYDHNAPTVEHLNNTHGKMFKAIRNEKPELPIIIMPRPKFKLTEEEEKRRSIIEYTYKDALVDGDKNVYFIDSPELTRLCKNDGTVDGCHPNDFGFVSMTHALYEVMESIKVK